MKDELIHPADALAEALERASSLLSVLTGLYNTKATTFSGGNSFVVHAISTASSLVDDARNALSDLHFGCDLTLLDHPDRNDIAIETMATASRSVPEEVAAPAPAQVQHAAPDPVAGERQEQFAKNYLELLKKLTAAEVFAAEQQALSAPGTTPDLLPLLRSLREDLQKIHNAA